MECGRGGVEGGGRGGGGREGEGGRGGGGGGGGWRREYVHDFCDLLAVEIDLIK